MRKLAAVYPRSRFIQPADSGLPRCKQCKLRLWNGGELLLCQECEDDHHAQQDLAER